MTGTPTLSDVSDAMAYGAFRYLSKPLNRRVGVGIVVTPVSRGPAALFCPLRSEAVKLGEVDLVGMQLETEFPKSLAEILPGLHDVRFVLESNACWSRSRHFRPAGRC